MASLIILMVASGIFAALGLWISFFTELRNILASGLAVMFIFTGLSHWSGLRAEMIKMVPPYFSHPDFWVTVTGLLECLGAIGLVVPTVRPWASLGLAILLIAMFPANIYASTHDLTLGGKTVLNLPARTLMQILYIVIALYAGAWI